MNAVGRLLAQAGQQPGVCWLNVVGDYMTPTLHAGDHVGVLPVLSYMGEGLYLLNVGGEGAVYRCESDSRGGFVIWADNPAYPTRYAYSRTEFHQALLGKVVVIGQVVDRTLLEAGRARA